MPTSKHLFKLFELLQVQEQGGHEMAAKKPTSNSSVPAPCDIIYA